MQTMRARGRVQETMMSVPDLVQPALWNDDDWEDLSAIRLDPRGAAHLRMVVAVQPPVDATVDDFISSILLAPSTWRESAFEDIGQGLIPEPDLSSGDTQLMKSAIGRWSHLASGGVDFGFVPAASNRLTTSLWDVANGRLQRGYGSSYAILQAWHKLFLGEQSITSFLTGQLVSVFHPRLAPLIFDPAKGRFSITMEEWSAESPFGNSKPDINFGFDIGTVKAVRLLGGEVKTDIVATLLVMRWILWLLINDTASLLGPAEPADWDVNKLTARKIIRQMWLQQVGNKLNFMFLTNGHQYIFFRAGAIRQHIYASRIYNNDGTIDDFDGSLLPPAWQPLVTVHQLHCRPVRIIVSLLRDACSQLQVDENSEEDLWDPPSMPDRPELPPRHKRSADDEHEPKDQTRPAKRTKSGRKSDDPERLSKYQSHAITVLSVSGRASGLGLATLDPKGPQGPFVALPYTAKESEFPAKAGRLSVKARQYLESDSEHLPRGVTVASFDVWAGSGAFADCFIGRLRSCNGETSCAFKVVKASTFDVDTYRYRDRFASVLRFPAQTDTAMKTLLNEAQLLHELKDLRVAPFPLGVWMAKNKLAPGLVGFVAMERCEEYLTHTFDEVDKVAIRALFKRLHDAGYIHGDVCRRHVRRLLDAKEDYILHEWRLIDFDQARYVGDREWAKKEEEQKVNQLLKYGETHYDEDDYY